MKLRRAWRLAAAEVHSSGCDLEPFSLFFHASPTKEIVIQAEPISLGF